MNFVLGRENLGGFCQRLSRFVRAGAWTVALLMVCVFACARKSEPPRISCVALDDEQRGSFMALADTSSVIQVHLDSRLSDENQRKIQNAATEWNRLSQTLRQKNLFTLDVGVLNEEQYPKAASDCSYDGGDKDRFWIIQENEQRRWKKLGFLDENPAGTIRCHQNETLERQVIFLNTDIAKPDQLQSIVLHEFGHTLGLDHSCQKGEGSADYIGCDHLKAEHPYREAILFPVLKLMSSNIGNDTSRTNYRVVPEVKESLQSNDQSRARCIL